MADIDEREEELTSLSAIYPEISIDPDNEYAASLEIAVAPAKPLLIRFIPSSTQKPETKDSYATAAATGVAHIEHDVELSHLPPLILRLTLPDNYPGDSPPKVKLTTQLRWLPEEKLAELENEVKNLWEEYGHCQILFSYIDYLQQAAEQGFDLDQSSNGCLVLPTTAEPRLAAFDSETRLAVFNSETYDCGICLEPKRGSSCFQLPQCGHVFCKHCLQDFYNSAINEGDVGGVRCLSPDCGKDGSDAKIRKPEPALHPRDLLAMGIEEKVARRYVELKRKKKLEADKTTVYCPRSWCQGPARSPKYPPIPADLSTYIFTESSTDDDGNKPSGPPDRLAICEKCSLAFCRTCYMGWHGPFARCFPRDPNELSAEEKASYDYIRMNTSPCPTCCSPTQKTMGCNHMKCFQCNTHFCYLCGAWLDGNNPYQHFNKAGTECYQRLWELEEGDNGQGPQDGGGFRGARGWEQMAIEVAREADAQEAAAAQAEEDEREARRLQDADGERAREDQLAIDMAQWHLDDDGGEIMQPARRQPNGRRQRNPFPAQPPAAGAANAVRNHERRRQRGNGRAGPVGRRPAANDDERQQAELQRFLEMAQRDEEDGWNSDELGDDDHGFLIR